MTPIKQCKKEVQASLLKRVEEAQGAITVHKSAFALAEIK